MSSLRTTPLLFVLLFFSACSGPDRADDSSVQKAEATPDRVFRFTYEATIPVPEGAKRVSVWVPLPPEIEDVQNVSEIEIRADHPVESGVDPVYGNRMVHLTVEEPKEPIAIAWSATIGRRADRGQGTGEVVDAYLEANRLVPVDGVARERAEAIGALKESLTPTERARRIYDDVLNEMAYDKSVPGYGKGDFQRAMTVCKGNCTDFHSRFIGVGRAAGIPVRFTMGVPLGEEPAGNPGGYHCWAHWHDGTTWQPVDISEADKVADSKPEKADWFFGNLDPDRVALSRGRDITLEPKQEGPPLNYFIHPHVEVDGEPIEETSDMVEFRYEDVRG